MTTPALPLPAWPEETTPEGLTFFGNAAAILAAWRAHGAPNAFALGMLAQAEAELAQREGRAVTLRTHIDPALLGGLVVQIGSQRIDGSIRTRLNSLAQAVKA